MKAQDEAEWQQLLSDLSATEDGIEVRDFMLDWVDEAEHVLDLYQGPAEALRAALPPAEVRHNTRVSVHMLGQMFCMLAMHWEFSEEMMKGLTVIEQRLVEDMLALKIALLEQEAQETEDV